MSDSVASEEKRVKGHSFIVLGFNNVKKIELLKTLPPKLIPKLLPSVCLGHWGTMSWILTLTEVKCA